MFNEFCPIHLLPEKLLEFLNIFCEHGYYYLCKCISCFWTVALLLFLKFCLTFLIFQDAGRELPADYWAIVKLIKYLKVCACVCVCVCARVCVWVCVHARTCACTSAGLCANGYASNFLPWSFVIAKMCRKGYPCTSPRKCDIWVSSRATSCAPVSMASHARFSFCLGNKPFSRGKSFARSTKFAVVGVVGSGSWWNWKRSKSLSTSVTMMYESSPENSPDSRSVCCSSDRASNTDESPVTQRESSRRVRRRPKLCSWEETQAHSPHCFFFVFFKTTTSANQVVTPMPFVIFKQTKKQHTLAERERERERLRER